MRQVMPHRNNIDVRRTKCKIFFAALQRCGLEWREKRRRIAWTICGIRGRVFDIVIQNKDLRERLQAIVLTNSIQRA